MSVEGPKNSYALGRAKFLEPSSLIKLSLYFSIKRIKKYDLPLLGSYSTLLTEPNRSKQTEVITRTRRRRRRVCSEEQILSRRAAWRQELKTEDQARINVVTI